jgi:tetratricopeptide (TPR) repeat protein
VALLLYGAAVSAQVASDATASDDRGQAGAHKHFDRALELYRAGRYAAALSELEQAAERDPNGKDLFFNLALVHEKLGQLPEAIVALERFRELETDRAERERARLSIERLRGALQTGESQPAPLAGAAPCPRTTPEASPRREPNPVLIATASVAVVSFVVGSVFGIKALSDDVRHAQTSDALPIDVLRERARRSEREALIADVALALSAASTATFVGVWWLSPREPARGAGITLRGYF